MGATTYCKLETTVPDIAASDANEVFAGVYAATSSATNAARSNVLAGATKEMV